MKNSKIFLATACRHQEAFFDLFVSMFEELCILILGSLKVELAPDNSDYEHPMSYIGQTTFGGIVVRVVQNLSIDFDTMKDDVYRVWGRISIELKDGDAHTVQFDIDTCYLLGMKSPTVSQECDVYIDDTQVTFDDITTDYVGDDRVPSFAGVLKAYLRQTGISEIGTPAEEVFDD